MKNISEITSLKLVEKLKELKNKTNTRKVRHDFLVKAIKNEFRKVKEVECTDLKGKKTLALVLRKEHIEFLNIKWKVDNLEEVLGFRSAKKTETNNARISKVWINTGYCANFKSNKNNKFISFICDFMANEIKDGIEKEAFLNIRDKYDLYIHGRFIKEVRLWLVEELSNRLKEVEKDFMEEVAKLIDNNFREELSKIFRKENKTFFDNKKEIKEYFLNLCKENSINSITVSNWEEYLELLSYQIRIKKIRLGHVQKRIYYTVYREL